MTEVKGKGIEAIYPLSALQRGIVFDEQLNPGSSNYIEQLVFEMIGSFNYGAFERAWKRIYQRHPVLRSRFKNLHSDQPVQVILKGVPLSWRFNDWYTMGNDLRNAALKKLLDSDRAAIGFDDALIHVSVIRIAPGQHQCVLSYHHSIMDGWSLAILRNELYQYYSAYCDNKTLFLPSPPAFRDYIIWLTRRARGGEKEYWSEYLRDYQPSALQLVSSKKSNDNKEQVYRVKLSVDTTATLKNLAKAREVTLNTVTQLLYGWLLRCYTGSNDVGFGTVTSGRTAPIEHIQTMVGALINTLPLRIRYRHDKPIMDALHDLYTQLKERNEYEHSALTDIQKYCDQRELFDTLFVFENYPSQNIGDEQSLAGDLLVVPRYLFKPTGYPLTVLVSGHNQLEFIFCYDASFSDAAIERLASHYVNLCNCVTDNISQPLGELTLLSETDIEKMDSWNRTAATYPAVNNVVAFFTERVNINPSAVAIDTGTEHISYEELYKRVQQLAQNLQHEGVVAGASVGLCLPRRSPDLVTSVLALAAIGAACVPLDASYPLYRLEQMLRQADISLLLTVPSLGEKLPVRRTLHIDRSVWRNQLTEKTLAICDAVNEVLYKLFTSGSTGEPKGVEVEHETIINLTHWERTRSVSGMNRTLQYAPSSFDVFYQEIFATLDGGGCLVLINNALHSDPFQLWQFIYDVKINRLYLPFVALQRLAEAQDALNLDCAKMQLLQIITAGEQLQITPAIRALFRSLSRCRLHNDCGPTETHVNSSKQLSDDVDDWLDLPSVGYALPNFQIYILNENLQRVPVGVSGHLYVAGPIARGYVANPVLTQEKFITNPFFTDSVGHLLYDTGDLAAYLPDTEGEIQLLGRQDGQVKIRGYRIEVGEVETMLSTLYAVSEAAIIPRCNPQTRQLQLVAFVVLNKNIKKQNASSIMLKRELGYLLPGYMIPNIFNIMESLPLTPSGKIDRLVLKTMANDLQLNPVEVVLPVNDKEKTLVSIFSTVLGVPESSMSTQADYHQLGLDSMNAVQIMVRCHQKAVHFSIANILEHNTLTELAAAKSRGQLTLADLDSDTSLHDINTKGLSKLSNLGDPENVLLTGASGYVGVHLLETLLHQTDATIYCLLRGDSVDTALARLRKLAKRYAIYNAKDFERVQVVCGDLAKSRLGLTSDTFQSLAESVNVIFHCGAWVGHVMDYQTLKPANVNGTRDIIRLATTCTIKPIHFISTTATRYVNQQLQHLFDRAEFGYPVSKWVAEQQMEHAGQLGVPVKIYQLGMMTVNNKTGIANEQDRIGLALRAFIMLGCAPDSAGIDAMFPSALLPVDVACQRVIDLAFDNTRSGIFYVDNSCPMDWESIFYLTDSPIERVPYDDWLSRVQAQAEHTGERIYDVVLSLYAKESLELLAEIGASVPPLVNASGMLDYRITSDTINEYMAYLRHYAQHQPS